MALTAVVLLLAAAPAAAIATPAESGAAGSSTSGATASGTASGTAVAQNPALGPVTLPVVPGTDLGFSALSGEDGLASAQVFGVARDHQGFLWFATGDGLNRYDGYAMRTFRSQRNDPNSLDDNSLVGVLAARDGALWLETSGAGAERFDPVTETFTHYRHDPTNPGSLSGDVLHRFAICEDSRGTIWIGTIGAGLNRLDPKTGTFTHYRSDPRKTDTLSSDQVGPVYADREGNVWVGTADAGLNRFDPSNGRVTRYLPNPGDPNALPDKNVEAIFEDRAGTLWVGTRNGFGVLDRQTGRFQRYTIAGPPDAAASLNADVTFFEDSSGMLWIGTEGAGVLRYDRPLGRLVQYQKNDADPHSLRNNFVVSLAEDPSGTLWMGTLGGGPNMLRTRPPKFAVYRHDATTPNSVADNFILSIFEDSTGTVWIGNDRTLNRWDRRSNTWRVYRNDPADPTSISNGSVTATQEDPDGTLWFGTYLGGLNRFDPRTGRFTAYRSDANNPASLSDDIVRALYRDSAGVLWVGGWHNGLNRFDRSTGRFQRYQTNPDKAGTLSGNSITDILEDGAKRLWVATEDGGLDLLDRATGTFTAYRNDPKNLKSLPDNSVRVLHEDRSGRLWVGTVAGLCVLDPQKGLCQEVYTHQDGLPNDTIEGILEDKRGDLWISTNNGLSRFDPATRSFRNYDVVDGLQSNEFHVFTAFCAGTRTGDLYFGGVNGFNVFDPRQVSDNPFVPPVVLTDFRLSGTSVPVGHGSALRRSLLYTDQLTLPQNRISVAFDFAALSYVAPVKNHYRYKLEGFDRSWHAVGSTQRTATYTNLDAGSYVLRVQGSNEDGVWNETGTSIRIVVTPPWWATWWFRLLALLVVLAGLFGLHRLRIHAMARRTRRLEAEVGRRTEELREVNSALEAFSFSVSHDLRAPLQRMDGFVRMLRAHATSTLDERGKHYLDVISTSSQRMDRLIDDLLTFSRLSRQEMRTEPIDLNQLVDEVIHECAPDAAVRDVRWQVSPLPTVTGDPTLLRAVFANLFMNALKFTRSRDVAEIEVGCRTAGDESVIFVRDNGVGFDMADADTLFGVFQRLHPHEEYEGSGIGLANVRRIVTRHGGTVRAEGEVDHGATFYLTLPGTSRAEPSSLAAADGVVIGS
ncbi:MAG TPA: two-component regulator propeller domain-containing protein [Kineosporiaceae bacterium]